MKAIISTVWPYAAFLIIGAMVGWFIENNRSTAKIERLNSIHASEIKSITDKAASDMAESVARINQLQSGLSALDAKSTQELQNAQKDNASLRDDVSSGKRRVLIAQSKLTACQRTSGQATSTGSMGDAAKVGLTAEAGRDVYDIRSGIISDQAKIDYLQGYIRKLQEGGYIAGGNKKAP